MRLFSGHELNHCSKSHPISTDGVVCNDGVSKKLKFGVLENHHKMYAVENFLSSSLTLPWILSVSLTIGFSPGCIIYAITLLQINEMHGIQ